MQFLHPLLLWGLLFIAVPILVHLFYFRRYRRVLFTNVALLREIQEEKSIRRRVRNLLVLITRIGAVVFMVWAFAQPFFYARGDQSSDPYRVSIYVDNSSSMQVLGEESNLLNVALDRAEQIIQSYDDKTRFQIMTNDVDAGSRRFLHPVDAITRLNQIEPSSKYRSLDQVVKTQKYVFSQEESNNKTAYLLSDFQKVNFRDGIQWDAEIPYFICPIETRSWSNLSVDSVWMESPKPILNESQNLYIRVKNYGNRDVQTSLHLTMNGRDQSLGSVSVPAGEEVVDTTSFTANTADWYRASVSLSDEGIHYDDDYYFAFLPIGQIQILEAYQTRPNSFVHASLSNSAFFANQSTSLGSISYEGFSDQDVIVVEDFTVLSSGFLSELSKTVSEGGVACLFLGPDISKETLAGLQEQLSLPQFRWESGEQKAFDIDYNHPIIKDVFEGQRKDLDLPTVEGYYRPLGQGQYLPVITLRNGDPLLGEWSHGLGKIYVYTTSVDPRVSNLANYPELLSPLIYKMGVQRGYGNPISATIGESGRFEVKDVSASESKIKIEIDGGEVIPYQYQEGKKTIVQTRDIDCPSGIYKVTADDKPKGYVALNVNRQESDITPVSDSELKSYFPSATVLDEEAQLDMQKTIKQMDTGSQFWKYLLIFVLILLATEIFLLRFWKQS